MKEQRKSGKEQLANEILDSWIGKLAGMIAAPIANAIKKIYESRKVKQ
jgi:hypothetical protein